MNAEQKIISRKKAAELSAQLKRSGKIVVTTNGSFDLLHAGHVYLLEEAKKKGNVLIVGINTDASVRSYKGPERPIVSEQERALLVAAIYCVDYVCFFEEPTCIPWVSEIKPSVHVKDINWADKKGRLIESDTVEKNGGKVFLLKRKPGLSTTNIIEKIQKSCCKK